MWPCILCLSQTQTSGQLLPCTRLSGYLLVTWRRQWPSASSILSCCHVWGTTSLFTSGSTTTSIRPCTKQCSSQQHSSRVFCFLSVWWVLAGMTWVSLVLRSKIISCSYFATFWCDFRVQSNIQTSSILWQCYSVSMWWISAGMTYVSLVVFSCAFFLHLSRLWWHNNVMWCDL